MSLNTIMTLHQFCEDALCIVKFGRHFGKTFCYVTTFDKPYCDWLLGITSSSRNIQKFQNYYRFAKEIVIGIKTQQTKLPPQKKKKERDNIKPMNAGKKWSKKDDTELINQRTQSISSLAALFSRTPRSIICRMKKLKIYYISKKV